MTVMTRDLAASTGQAERGAPAALAGAASCEIVSTEVFADLDAAEALWRRMEADPSAHGTPYQRFDWVAAYLDGTEERGAARIVVLRDGEGRARLLLPLVLRREAGCRVARFVGDKHANFHLPLAAGAPLLDGRAVRDALRRAGQERLGVDLLDFALQPAAWDGRPNPLAAGGLPAASDAYGMAVDADPEATLKRVFSGEARKKLRQKERRLAELLGPVEHRRARDAAEVDAILDAFHAHKAARFAAMGVADPFAEAGARDFLRRACLAGLGEDQPAVELHALLAGGRIVATFAGAVDGRHFSGMVNAFDPDPEIARASPGDQLLLRLVRDQAARGRTALDLGVGEARYKASTCALVVPLFEGWIPVTLRGRALAGVRQVAVRARRRVKRTPWALALLARLRRRGV